MIIEKIPLFVLAASSCAITFVAQLDTIRPLEQLPISARLANAAAAYAGYLVKMVYPADLAVLYPLAPTEIWKVIAALLLLAGISAAALAARRRCPYLLVGWLWYLGTLVPVIGLVQVGRQAMADRYTYLTQIGLYVAAAWGAVDLVRSRPQQRSTIVAVAVLTVAGLLGMTWLQTRHWRNSEALWVHTLACTGPNAPAHNNLGNVYAGRGDKAVGQAIEQYEKALEIEPNFPDALNNLGIALANRGKFEEAIPLYQKALKIHSNLTVAHYNLGNALAECGRVKEAIIEFEKALAAPDYAGAHYNLANALARDGQRDQAVAHYQQALEIDPEQVAARTNLANTLADLGRRDEAIEQYRKVLAIKPGFPEALNNLGNSLASGKNATDKDFDEACDCFIRALQAKPDLANAHSSLALILDRRQRPDEALVHYRKAVELKPDFARGHDNLGIALLNRGDAAAALEQFQQALDLAKRQNDKDLADAVQERIDRLR